jgi:HAD-superfamily hydrolase, subfamily IIB
MDGTTLLDDHASISPRTERAIRSAVEQGIFVVPATGRLTALLPPSVMALGGIRYAITSNGALTCDMHSGEVLYSSFIPPELALKVLDLLPPDKFLVEIFRNGKILVEQRALNIYLEQPNPFLNMNFRNILHEVVDSLSGAVHMDGERIEKVNLPYVPREYQERMWSILSELEGLALTSSVQDNIEINSSCANKGAALKNLCERLHIPAESVMAVGDNGNDIEMLKYAGFSLAPANGTEEAKAAANAVTATNGEDGVALAIETYALDQ